MAEGRLVGPTADTAMDQEPGTPPRTDEQDQARFALGALELGSVLAQLARHTSFSAGTEAALALRPTSDVAEARRRQAETTEALRLPGLRPSLHLGGVHDIRPLAARARIGGVLRPDELLDVASTVRSARAWRRGLRPLRDELPTLLDLAEQLLSDHPGLAEDIADAIGEGGAVLDSASPALARIRAELRGAHGRLVTRLREIMANAPFKDVVQDPVVTERAGRYVIPVRSDAGRGLPAIVHDQSASGATLFVEPLAVVDMANRWRELGLEETREVERILGALSKEVGQEADSLVRSVEGLTFLDVARAKAALAEEHRAAAPDLVSLPTRDGEPVLRLVQARHPLLHGTVVPQTIELGGDFDVLLITGPNTGGKTVALKTAGLLTLMAQAGMHVPADEGSRVAVFHQVQADIGDEQSLEQSLSTFSSHVRRIVRMLQEADSCSLLLLDELGAGTDPQEGAALARALVDDLRARGAYVIATTHYPELKSYAHVTERVENASVEFDVETLSPTYRLTIGLPGRSNAIAIAERLGMPRAILNAATANLAPRSAEVETLLQEIAQDRETADDARRRALQEAAEAATQKARARQLLKQAERQHQEVWQTAQEQAEAELSELRREAHRLRLQLQSGGRGSDARAAVEAALSLPALQARPTPSLVPEPDAEEEEAAQAATFDLGASVLVPRLGVPGRVVALRGNEVELDVLGRRVRVARSELDGATRASAADERRAERERAPVARRPPVMVASDRGDVPLTLDLRGRRVEEALEQLEAYIEDAAAAGLPEARIIHGKGTGAMRAAVRETLRRHRLVHRFASEPDAQGGDGATQVWLSA